MKRIFLVEDDRNISNLIYKSMLIGGADALPWASIGISVLRVLLAIFSTMMYSRPQAQKRKYH